jgi:hypothetical protein
MIKTRKIKKVKKGGASTSASTIRSMVLNRKSKGNRTKLSFVRKTLKNRQTELKHEFNMAPETFKGDYIGNASPLEINVNNVKCIIHNITPTLTIRSSDVPHVMHVLDILNNTVNNSSFFNKTSNFYLYNSKIHKKGIDNLNKLKIPLNISDGKEITDINLIYAIKSIIILIENNLEMYKKQNAEFRNRAHYHMFSSKFLPHINVLQDINIDVTISNNTYKFLLKYVDDSSHFELYKFTKSKIPFRNPILDFIYSPTSISLNDTKEINLNNM